MYYMIAEHKNVTLPRYLQCFFKVLSFLEIRPGLLTVNLCDLR